MPQWSRDTKTGAWTWGSFLAEKVYSPKPRGYDWYLTGPDWDYGICDSLDEAKERAFKQFRETGRIA